MSRAAWCRAAGTGILAAVSVLLTLKGTAASPVSPASPSIVSRPSPFTQCSSGRSVQLSDGSAGYIDSASVYSGDAVEPAVAANPRTAAPGHTNLIGVWQQDRWPDGGARGIIAGYSFDGGRTWKESSLPFSTCASRRSLFVRASDPWVSIGPDGTAYASALGLGSATNAILVATSTDGGRSWGPPRDVILDRTRRYQDDKPSITADPSRSGVAYVTWNRTRQPDASHHLHSWFAETTDGGRSWSAPQQIAPSLDGANAIGHQIVVDPKRHILYDIFLQTHGTGDPDEAARTKNTGGETTTTRLITVVTSRDGGRTWSAPHVIARVPTLNSLADFLYRLGYPLPAAAIDPISGILYVAWTDPRVDQGNRPEIALAASAAGGSSWSAPLSISGPARPAFTPAIGVDGHGVVGVTFYSATQLYAANTDSDPHPPAVLVNAWFVSSVDGGRHFGHMVHLGGPFNYWAAPFANGYFLGDYQGLAVSGRDFHPFFVMAASKRGRNRTDIFTRSVRPR